MTPSMPPWLVVMLIMAMRHFPVAHALPCRSDYQCDMNIDQADDLSFSPITQVPTATIAAQGSDTTGTYFTQLESDVRPYSQPFPTEISYIAFEPNIGLLHPGAPHLDSAPAAVLSALRVNSSCYYKGHLCPGLPHVEETRIASWLLPLSTASVNADISIGITIPPNPPLQTSVPGCEPPYPITSSESSTPTPVVPLPSSSTPTAIPSPHPPIMSGQNIFEPISRDPIPQNIASRDDHPLKRDNISDTPGPVSTNKFYANFFIGSQANYAFVHPYAVGWAKGTGSVKSDGLTISHTEANQLAFGPKNQKIPGEPVQFFINPIGIQSMVLSAAEIGNSTVLTVSNPLAFSANIILRPNRDSDSNITFPLVQGMGYVTGVYTKLQPVIQSGVSFRQLESAPYSKQGIFKYKVTLEDNTTWLIYVTPGDGADPKLKLENNGLIKGPGGFSGTIQVAKNPNGGPGETIYDNSAGVYPVVGNITGSVVAQDATGTYSLTWDKAGKDVDKTPLLMFALPHHVQSFNSETQGKKVDLLLRTTTKGMATAVAADSWTMVENDLPIEMGFAPWNPAGTSATLSKPAKQTLKDVAPNELSQDIHKQTNLNSMYFSGKGLAKFAMVVYAVRELAQDAPLSESAFGTLKDAFATFVNNKQQLPLVYDNVWKGIVSSGTYETGDTGLDFGNTLYNDHHFHYGYFILSAAIIGSLDPSWIDGNKAWVNSLVRDAGNSVSDDPLFPFSRGFDWYNGHSWAKGLFESIDGKDQESTSEDTMFAYAVKMWGKTVKDPSMEARGNMMLAILARSLNNYFLMKSDNTNQPPNFIGNKVTGILFENKADHTTYFGANLEYIQGIHMLPLIPSSAYTRHKDFVREEWDAMFSEKASTPASKVQGGWQGVLYSNLALIDPGASWDFFAREPFDLSKIDGGASRTWYLAYAAGLGGGPH
ncbi:endo-1,3(4)-beta-glucanase [Blastomyces parvus]|uniref:glucan endo-1,3-beta-D-glucosidase n=1 Tax=Blastomyces parvus TaxID=2060905 RepID=A0A2B7WIH7_9EURO|nr:endo-1,3(4)-beta-glucanase [Blastomyces parvus]